ncbi:3-dehydrosphinganine reductase [Glugoides intestinalis]
MAEFPITTMVYDSLNVPDHPEESFDYVFYLPGIAYPGYFKDQEATVYDKQINLNFLGMIKSLYKFKPSSQCKLTFVMACSTAALFPLPGYASYSPSKAAMHSFFETAHNELVREGIRLKILYCCSMKTPGLRKENESKPEFTKRIEYSNTVADPDIIAKYFIDNMEDRSALAYDWFTYFCLIRNRCECAIDYFLFPVAVLIIFISRVYVNYSFRKDNK